MSDTMTTLSRGFSRIARSTSSIFVPKRCVWSSLLAPMTHSRSTTSLAPSRMLATNLSRISRDAASLCE